MDKDKITSMLLGAGIGLLTIFLSTWIILIVLDQVYMLETKFSQIIEMPSMISPFLKLGTIPAIIPFYIFLNKNKYYISMGIMMIAIAVFIFTFALNNF